MGRCRPKLKKSRVPDTQIVFCPETFEPKAKKSKITERSEAASPPPDGYYFISASVS